MANRWDDTDVIAPDFEPLAGPKEDNRLCLVVSPRDLPAVVYPLPEKGELTIGRGDCDIVLAESAVSRKHLVLNVGEPLSVRDLSVNGVWIRGARIPRDEPVEIGPGWRVVVGTTELYVQPRSAVLAGRRVWSNEHFGERLDEACARRVARGEAFSLARLVTEKIGLLQMEETLANLLLATDVAGWYAPGEYQLLFLDQSPEAAQTKLEAIRARLSRDGARVSAAIVSYPEDGRDAEALVSSLTARARGERESDGVHLSDLADLAEFAEGPMRDLFLEARAIAPGSIAVLILGETGVGKGVLAERIHEMSPRAQKPFLPINCGLLRGELAASDLFGHKRGTFTGADRDRVGFIESANGGTVFFDEIGELPLHVQPNLLRVLEEGLLRPMGTEKPRKIDVRFIAATNRDLEKEVAAGRFREDLYYRLNPVVLKIPPLRERVSEIEGLARRFVAEEGPKSPSPHIPELSPEAVALLRRYEWPGNIRELRNMMQRAVLLCRGDLITPAHLKIKLPVLVTTAPQRPLSISPAPFVAQTVQAQPLEAEAPARGSRRSMKEEQRELEKQSIIEALRMFAWNQTQAAKYLDMPRRTFCNRLVEYGIDRPRTARKNADGTPAPGAGDPNEEDWSDDESIQ